MDTLCSDGSDSSGDIFGLEVQNPTIVVINNRKPLIKFFSQMLKRLAKQKLIRIFDEVDVVYIKRGIPIKYLD